MLYKTKYLIRLLIITLSVGMIDITLIAQNHPNLILTKPGVEKIRGNMDAAPLFAQTLAAAQNEVDAEIDEGIAVPVPKDMAGGYTHERHKKNFFILQKAGVLFQVTGEEKYAAYIRDMLLDYAKLYPTLGLHPTNRSYATGKIFWQCLNDANWLVYVSQAYDCVYEWLEPAERALLEKDLFRPMADFLSLENPRFFNRIHNHSTWANAAVGMIGLVMGDEELVKRALYGLEDDQIPKDARDNDGGFIKIEGKNVAGFLAQLDYSFSPDGHFTEGPYYLRYAIYPYLLFAKSLVNHKPDLGILKYRDGILTKSVYALLYQSDPRGAFFPINDAQKGMSWLARELVAAVDITYFHAGDDPRLLSIAEKQSKVFLDEAGFQVAIDLAQNKAQPFAHQSIEYRDGDDGKKGGLGILRMNGTSNSELCLVMKYAAHGMGHGHFDRLSYALYDDDGEVIQDYGSARWVNIDQKGGGRYLPENKTWAKQTIAHNTVTVNEKTQFKGKVKAAEQQHPSRYFFDASNPNVAVVSAKETSAYSGTELHRTMVMINDEQFRNPLILDLFRVEATDSQQYDLPWWFQGHLLSTNFDYTAETSSLSTMGEAHGYQHLWKEAEGKAKEECAQICWFYEGKFFTLTTDA